MSGISVGWRARVAALAVAAALPALLVLPGTTVSGQPRAASSKPTIVLEHGAWADDRSCRESSSGCRSGASPSSSARPAARTGRRRRLGLPGELLGEDPGPHRPGRSLVRRHGHHQRRVGNPNVKAWSTSTPISPTRATARRSHHRFVSASTPPRASSRYPPPALSTSTSRWPRTRLHRLRPVLRQRRAAGRGGRPGRRTAAALRSRPGRSIRAAGVVHYTCGR